jgi:hypothetical protein
MSFRSLSRIALLLALPLAWVSSVRAEPESAAVVQSSSAQTSASADPHPQVAEPSHPAPSLKIAGFDLLATVGYGAATGRVYRLNVEPYGAMFGLETGYTWSLGLRLGAYFQYGLGRTKAQLYEPFLGDSFHTTVEASGFATGISLGYDLKLRFLILRHTLGFGLSWMRWEFTELPKDVLAAYAPGTGSTVGFHLAPGLALFWPIGIFEVGVGFDYFITFEDRTPPGILSKLSLGVRL